MIGPDDLFPIRFFFNLPHENFLDGSISGFVVCITHAHCFAAKYSISLLAAAAASMRNWSDFMVKF